MSNELNDIREQLDKIDRRILEALADRQKIIVHVAQLKATGSHRLRDIQREQNQLTRMSSLGRELGLDAYFVTRLFRHILDYSVRYQQEYLADQQDPERRTGGAVTVAYQGVEGAYSQIAATKHFGPRGMEIVCVGYESFEQMLEAVKSGAAQYGMLPIENTTAGSINEAYDLLARMNLPVVGEEVLSVEHCLVATEEVPVGHIRRVYSHPQALAQCSSFLSSLHHCAVEPYIDTALAVKKIQSEQDNTQAAIASEEAANLYGLVVIRRGIGNLKDNYTRFVVVARESANYDPRIACKTSLIFATRDEKGALLKCLNVLAAHALNLTKLESRPRPNVPWEYLFYLDFEGNTANAEVKAALQELTVNTSYLKVLGSYPARTTKDALPAEPLRQSPARPPKATSAEPVADVEPTVASKTDAKPYKLVTRAQRKQDTTVAIGAVVVGAARRVVIAGPSAVESREQILLCARAAQNAGVDVLSGGCFRPSTDSESFASLGFSGLELLAEAGRVTGLPVSTEVIDPADVPLIAKHANVLQVGGRNMQNYALLREVGRVDRPVILKRGLTASIEEWLTAAEYILRTGNQQVILCERGIRTFEAVTRSALDLASIPMVRELTHLPVIVDPTRACAAPRFVTPLVEASLASGAQGIMLEFHPDPARALADSRYALSTESFERLMHQIANQLG
jgi:chorismate mutase/prephenate dehydratase